MPIENFQSAIIIPCFNESKSIIPFLQSIGEVINTINEPIIVVAVDDCSQDDSLGLLQEFGFSSSLHQFHVISLRFNLGHQGAIYQGILYVSGFNVKNAIIMDSDGEDDPAAIPELYKKREFSIVVVRRGKRKESLSFRICYVLYKVIFRIVTGRDMDYGNYCMIGKEIVERILYTSFIHLPAYLLKQKASKTFIQFDRQKRIGGKSKMSLQSLLIHGFKSLIEFGDELMMLFLKLFVIILIILVFMLADVFYQKFIARTAILGWFSTLTIGLMNLGMLCFGFFILGILLLNLIHQQNNKAQHHIYKIIKA
jgi:glycosyltransferase involved in cell wall biosynthesis